MIILNELNTINDGKDSFWSIFFVCFAFLILTVFMSGTLYLALLLEIILFIAYALKNYEKKICLNGHPNYLFIFWYFVFWSYITINAIFVSEYYFPWKTIVIYQLPVVFFIFSCNRLNSDALLKIFYKSCIICNILLIIYLSIAERNAIFSGERLGSSGVGVNATALYLGVFNSVTLFLYMFKNIKQSIYLFLPSVLFTMLTGSKKGIISIFLLIVIFAIIKNKWKAYKYVIPSIVLICIIDIISKSSYFYDLIGRRFDIMFENIINPVQNNSTGIRIEMYDRGIDYFKKNMLWGNGRGFFEHNSEFGTYSHSNYMEMLVSFGLFGTLCYYSFFLYTIIASLKLIKKKSDLILFIFTIIQMIILDFAAVTYYSFGFIYIILFITSKIISEESHNNQLENI